MGKPAQAGRVRMARSPKRKSGPRPVRIGPPISRSYPSIQSAADLLGTSYEEIVRMVARGEAAWVNP